MLAWPTQCDSCIFLRDDHTCEAFPQGIILDFDNAEMHDQPLPEQDNDVVYERDPEKVNEYDDFLEFRAGMINRGLIKKTNDHTPPAPPEPEPTFEEMANTSADGQQDDTQGAPTAEVGEQDPDDDA